MGREPVTLEAGWEVADAVCRRFHLQLMKHARSLVAPEGLDEAEDLVQETYLRVPKMLSGAGLECDEALAGDPPRVLGLCLACLRRLAANRRNRIRRREALLACNGRDAVRHHDLRSSVETSLACRDVLDSLTNSDATVLQLRYLQGMSYRGIGEALGISDGAARKRATVARERARMAGKWTWRDGGPDAAHARGNETRES